MPPITETFTLAVFAGLLTLMQVFAQSMVQTWKARTDTRLRVLEKTEEAKLRAQEKQEDYERQDEVAARVEIVAKQAATAALLVVDVQKNLKVHTAEIAARVETAAKQAATAASLVVEVQADTNARTDEVARIAAEDRTQTKASLERIHTLVNSDMTAARTSERDAMRLLVISLRRSLALGAENGTAIEAIHTAEHRIVELDKIIADRHAAQAKVDAEAALAKEKTEQK